MRFLCDHMLSKVGKWLRAAGYDTRLVESGMNDRQILTWALEERRLLLTRDKHFLEMKEACENLIFLSANSVEECIQELNQKVEIDWLWAPFSRCLLCNTPLVIPDEQMISKKVPPAVIQLTQQFWYCSQCEKVYWEGSHTKHMLNQLHTWQRGH